jgi:DnaJ family protein C protein 28
MKGNSMSTDAERAKERAEAYRQQDEEGKSQGDQAGAAHPGETARTDRTHRTPEQWNDLICQKIEEAMRAGAFDNLPGRGKPLAAAPEPHVPADMQMANSILRNNNLTPAWISDRVAVLTAIERFRRRLREEVTLYKSALAAAEATHDDSRRAHIEQEWRHQVEKWREELRTLNRTIELQNFRQPADFLEIFKLQLDEEISRASH